MNFNWKFDEHSFELISSIFPRLQEFWLNVFRNGTELYKGGKIYF